MGIYIKNILNIVKNIYFYFILIIKMLINLFMDNDGLNFIYQLIKLLKYKIT